MNHSSGRGLGQPWLRGAAALATMVCLALLAACGGSPSAAASGTGGSTRVQGATCLRQMHALARRAGLRRTR